MHILALIPARGGSKGIPRKNLLPVAGKPLIAYSIEQGLASTRITRILVSTDDVEIAAVSREAGADVPFLRPPEFARDDSPDIEAFRHALEWLRDEEGYRPDVVVHLRPPGPVRRVELIDRAIDLLVSHPDADAVRSVSLARQTPYKMWRVEGERLEPVLRLPGQPDCQSVPRQQLPKVYWQNGYVDVLRPRAVLDKRSMWGERVLPLIVEEELWEIDYPEDVPAVEDALRELQQGTLHSSREAERHSV